MTGSVIYGVEIFDAATARLLSAYVTKQYPGAYDIKASVRALAAARGVRVAGSEVIGLIGRDVIAAVAAHALGVEVSSLEAQ